MTAADLLSAWRKRQRDVASQIAALQKQQYQDRIDTMTAIEAHLREATGQPWVWIPTAQLRFERTTDGGLMLVITGDRRGYHLEAWTNSGRTRTRYRSIEAAALAAKDTP